MVFTTRKPASEILSSLGECRALLVIGCAECAAICQTGGSSQIEEAVEELERAGKEVLATVSLASPCDRRLARRDLKRVETELTMADAILCLSCGGGVQAVADVVAPPVFAGLDSHFVATVERLGVFREECALCGTCLLNESAGLCPQTRCPKGIRNGPCEGSHRGTCDADPESECVWELIHRELARQGKLETFSSCHGPPDELRWGRPRRTGGRP
jgi:ferredoxin